LLAALFKTSADFRARRGTRDGTRFGHRGWLVVFAILAFAGCRELPPPPKLTDSDIVTAPEYVIAPLDTVQIFVWRAPELSVTVPVRPDGRITIPLVEDLVAAGKSPTILARDIEEALRPFVQEPKASVVVEGFANQTTQMVKVIGEVARPVTMHYQMHMSVLDVMAEAQGLTEFADGNDAKLIRKANGREQTYQLKLQDLLEDGRMSANAKLRPGDLIVVPKSLL
jgi:polysaccharide export outer membrane protein